MAMQIGWGELGRYLGGAFALYMVLEGVFPFLNPGGTKRLLAGAGAGRAQSLALGRIDQHGGGARLAMDGA
jgi:uncharacterized protein YjeT (DUF2065 family)